MGSPGYWHRPQVWGDVHSAYEKDFQLNPNADEWHHNYVRDAYLCGRYAEFLQQVKLFGGYANCAFFGGEQKFTEMLANAAAEIGINK